MNNIAKVLIIAGSDPSGGAGIQADIKSLTANQVYCGSVITCLTAQNTQKVSDIFYPSESFINNQLDSVFEDIDFDVVKIGMLGKEEIIKIVQNKLKNRDLKIVLDPVMVATSGDVLLEKKAVLALKEFVNDCFLVTPNIDEAEILSGLKINNLEDVKKSAIEIKKLGAKNILIKTGHLKQKDNRIYNILLDEKNEFYIIRNDRLEVGDVHGTGCSLASVISGNLAKKDNLIDSIEKANQYVFNAIRNNLSVGKGSKILKHFF